MSLHTLELFSILDDYFYEYFSHEVLIETCFKVEFP
jgi:hypothetical protein